ncbi:energy-coupling factor transporter ATPase [Alkalicoccus luteus]|uniref:Energy-coupling factor transporter ATPase n=1 Tax=Alkalicoccus luteus TaxID=1237094 RepID=A0A969PQC3_9BACI|nr:energy-coupling factor transporter ATPase [Alkalicoccus luteus]NJP36033.1 energy-coupling factor transporter ATPase [Alkalicoccus luteus]
MSRVIVENVSFSYDGETDVVKNVSFTAAAGEWLAVTGHNGSGKSTLARCLNGLLLPRNGTVTTCGFITTDPETIMTLRRRAGMVFQQPDNQLVAPTVADDIAFGLENAGVPYDEMKERVEAAVKRLGLSGLEDREPHRLSGGQKQRVALAGITALKPDVIILDEASSMLDPAGRSDVRDVVRRLCREDGITVIMITHDLEEAAEADRMLVMREGQLTADAPPAELFKKPDLLKEAGLVLPLAVLMAERLRLEGFDPGSPTSEEELVRALCNYV